MRGNCIVIQSGGPTAVINNSLIGIVDEILNSSFKGEIYGAVGSIHGLLNGSFLKLNEISSSDRYLLRHTPGAALGSWRYKLKEDDFQRVVEILKKNDIRYFFYIGGNGSMDVAKLVDMYAKSVGYDLVVIGIPKSIDNDLLYTDHSPGFGSAAKFLATSVLDIKMDMASYPESRRITIVETMGRHTGWLAGACSLAEHPNDECQQLIYIPEVPFLLNECLKKVSVAYAEKRNTIIIVSEGIRNKSGELIGSKNITYDNLGRPKLGGVSSYLKEIIEKESGIPTRNIEQSVWQRSNMRLASKTDADEAYQVGRLAWQFARDGYNGVMVSLKRYEKVNDYKIIYEAVPLEKVAGKERFVPVEWYDAEVNTMTLHFKNYASPIINGEILQQMHEGLPKYKKLI